MKNFYVTLCLFVLLIQPSIASTKLIHIYPLGNVDQRYLNRVQAAIKSFYKYDCQVEKNLPITNDLISPIKKRIDAQKVLSKFNTNDNILIITEKDICHEKITLSPQKSIIPEYGILGLGKRPGKVCVISTFRMRNKVPFSKTLERLEKVALHEIGHNLGLNHCNFNISCLMNDAKGKIAQVDREKLWLCEKCSIYIGRTN